MCLRVGAFVAQTCSFAYRLATFLLSLSVQTSASVYALEWLDTCEHARR